MTESSSELFTQELFVQLYQGYSFKIKASMQLQQKELQQEKKNWAQGIWRKKNVFK